MKDNGFEITVRSYDKTITLKWDHSGIALPAIIQSFCEILIALGWSRENIIDLFNDDGETKNNPFEWEVH